MRTRSGGFDPHTLAGAYVLDAVDDELERRRFERHLDGCPECAQEVVTLTETAARLGRAVAAEPPPGLRERVMAEIDQVRQLPPAVPAPGGGRFRPRVSGWRPRLSAVIVAAATAAVAVLGLTTVQARQELEEARHAERRIAAVLTAADARTFTAPAVEGGRGRVVVSRSQGRMVFWASGLADLPDDRVYQLWQLAPGKISSAGLLSPDATGATLPVISVTGEGVAQVGVTVEPAGGSAQPTTTPLLLVDLPAA
ncbi:anti-sigma factor [Planobispora longispora]|uniref:Regulator of SigK n=1 Tax=Planobispora longispora TaxID=28887 RepID=A0A8J3RTR8_9ACTN|nr:anti-sigma factor [Planobispora longispora]BFE89262.1 anti-sigma factor [Planobispora longispora]BFE89418.1 anti-sigma factor [Planobispora longispora]GIH80993.1 hypothetical protein Plo01_74220 [Planobispora longispora]